MKTIPTFVLSNDKRIEPNSITNLIVFDPAERTELQDLAKDVREIADSLSAGADGFFYLNDEHRVPRSFLDRMAERLSIDVKLSICTSVSFPPVKTTL